MKNIKRNSSKNCIILLSCVKSKQNKKCRAEDMYISSLFQKMMIYAKSLTPKKIFVLSAKYGLLHLDDVIEPYEKTLKNMKISARREWAEEVVTKLDQLSDLKEDEFVFLAGSSYREHIIPHIQKYSVPMKGLPFGKQLQWLGEKING